MQEHLHNIALSSCFLNVIYRKIFFCKCPSPPVTVLTLLKSKKVFVCLDLRSKRERAQKTKIGADTVLKD
jgi:hypothetical protein